MDDSSRRSPAYPAATAASSRSTESEPSPARVSLVAAVRGWLKHTLGSRGESSLKEALEEVIEEHDADADSDDRLEPEERVMLHNVLSFGDLTVSDIMVPRTDIVAVPVDIMLADLKAHILEQQHTRIPVYQDTMDNLLGFLHVKDLLAILAGDTAFDPHAIMRPLIFVPPSMRILDLLVKMRSSGSHMAIVVDEYGGTDGLITMEDLFEEIVGDIHDEHDGNETDDEHISQPADGIYEVSARISIETLEQKLGLQLVTEESDSDFDTLGGLIFFQLGRVPLKGEVVEHVSGIRFEVIDADPRRIRRVRIVVGGKPAQAA